MLRETLGDIDGETDALGDCDGLIEALGDWLGEIERLTDGEILGLRLGPDGTSGIASGFWILRERN